MYNVAVLNGFADVLTGTKARPRGSPVHEEEDEVADSDSSKRFGTRTADPRGAGLTQWESQNQKARALLLRSVDEMFHWQLIDMETASDAWTYLAGVHSLTRRSAIRLLQIELYNLYLDENGDMEEHLRSFGSLVVRGRQVDMEEFLTDTETCASFIRSLPYRLKTEISQAWSRLPLEDQTVPRLISLYLEEMCNKRVYAAKLAASVALKASAQGTSGGGKNGRGNGRGNGGPNGGTGNY